MPIGVAVVAWYALSVGALLWAGMRLAALSRSAVGAWGGTLAIAALCVNFGPIASCLQRGQFGVLLSALLIESVWQATRRASALCGGALALAVALKAYPVLAIVAPLARREWRTLGALVAWLVILFAALPAAAIGPRAALELSSRWASGVLSPALAGDEVARRSPHSTVNALSSTNQSLYGVLGRWLAADAIEPGQPRVALTNWPPDRVRSLARGAGAAFLVLAAVALAVSRRGEGWSRWAAWSIPILLTNVVGEIAWHHYHASLSLGYAAAGAGALGGADPRARRLLAVGLVVAVATNWAHFASPLVRSSGALLVGTLALAASLGLAVLISASEGRRGVADSDHGDESIGARESG